MQAVSLIVLGLLGALFLYVAVRMSMAIGQNLQQGMAFREALALRMKSLRLEKMLGAIGVDSNRYLHTEPVTDIARQMHNCQGCKATDTCDSALQARPSLSLNEIEFCPNQPALVRIRMEEDDPTAEPKQAA
ncbi:MAG: hypothetical protein KDH88_11845 [Chromatiales bacterium]|nr:hypothetical protein [Chromatiales bacterium]